MFGDAFSTTASIEVWVLSRSLTVSNQTYLRKVYRHSLSIGHEVKQGEKMRTDLIQQDLLFLFCDEVCDVESARG
jgi:hypothetical protein